MTFAISIYSSCSACNIHQWQCDYGTCISRELRCDHKIDCLLDDSDERDCRPPPGT